MTELLSKGQFSAKNYKPTSGIPKGEASHHLAVWMQFRCIPDVIRVWEKFSSFLS